MAEIGDELLSLGLGDLVVIFFGDVEDGMGLIVEFLVVLLSVDFGLLLLLARFCSSALCICLALARRFLNQT